MIEREAGQGLHRPMLDRPQDVFDGHFNGVILGYLCLSEA